MSGTLGAHEKVQVGAGVLALFGWCAEPSVRVTAVPALVSLMFPPGAHYLPAQRQRRLRPVLGSGVPPRVRATAEKQSSLPALRHSEHLS